MPKAKLDLKAPRRKARLKKWYLAHGGKTADLKIGTFRGFSVLAPRVGLPARALIKRVQHMAKLEHQSGQFDQATLKLLFPPSLRKRFMAVALSELGTHEWPDGSNWGPVQKFLAAVGIRVGAPWCAAFVVWCLKRFGYNGPLPPLPGYVPSWLTWAKAHNLLKPITLATRGDILIFNWPGTDPTVDHIGFCFGGWINKLLRTLEGNIGAHGGQVTETTRSVGVIVACVDLKKLLALDS